MKTVLVVGGAGHIGSFLCAELCWKKRTRVVCVDNLCTGDIVNVEDLINRINFEFIRLDFASYQPWRAIDSHLDSKTKVSGIYYLASSRDINNMYGAHLQGLMNALDMSAFHRCPITIVSPPHSRKKLDPNSSAGSYYYTKKAGESIAIAYQDKYRIKLTIFELDPEQNSLTTEEVAHQILWG